METDKHKMASPNRQRSDDQKKKNFIVIVQVQLNCTMRISLKLGKVQESENTKHQPFAKVKSTQDLVVSDG